MENFSNPETPQTPQTPQYLVHSKSDDEDYKYTKKRNFIKSDRDDNEDDEDYNHKKKRKQDEYEQLLGFKKDCSYDYAKKKFKTLQREYSDQDEYTLEHFIENSNPFNHFLLSKGFSIENSWETTIQSIINCFFTVPFSGSKEFKYGT